jgi:hypothetical protein
MVTYVTADTVRLFYFHSNLYFLFRVRKDIVLLKIHTFSYTLEIHATSKILKELSRQ